MEDNQVKGKDMLAEFATLSQLDISHDMFVERRRVIELARNADEREFETEITMLECAAGQTGHGTSDDGLAYRKWMKLLSGENSMALVMTNYERYDIDKNFGTLSGDVMDQHLYLGATDNNKRLE